MKKSKEHEGVTDEQKILCRFETIEHIKNVQAYLQSAIEELEDRCIKHDASKLEEPEFIVFSKYTPFSSEITYGSEAYKNRLKNLREALKHHYANNPHHPEFYKDGILGMTIIDLLEMICDWLAANKRHKDGDINISLLVNKERFNISDDLIRILRNTAYFLLEVESIDNYASFKS